MRWGEEGGQRLHAAAGRAAAQWQLLQPLPLRLPQSDSQAAGSWLARTQLRGIRRGKGTD